MKRRLTLVCALVLVLWLGLPGFWAGETGGRAHAYVPPRVPGGSARCPALPPPSGPAVTVSSEAELRDQAYNAESGTTILVAAGTFYLQDTVHVVHDGITIRGATGNREDVILDGGGMLTWTHTHVIAIDADDVIIADLTIRA